MITYKIFKSSGTDQEKEIFMMKIEANTPTDVKFESCTIEQDKPFSVKLLLSILYLMFLNLQQLLLIHLYEQ